MEDSSTSESSSSARPIIIYAAAGAGGAVLLAAITGIVLYRRRQSVDATHVRTIEHLTPGSQQNLLANEAFELNSKKGLLKYPSSIGFNETEESITGTTMLPISHQYGVAPRSSYGTEESFAHSEFANVSAIGLRDQPTSNLRVMTQIPEFAVPTHDQFVDGQVLNDISRSGPHPAFVYYGGVAGSGMGVYVNRVFIGMWVFSGFQLVWQDLIGLPLSSLCRSDYFPQHVDELVVERGRVFYIERIFEDGWSEAININTTDKGMVPVDTLMPVEDGTNLNVQNEPTARAVMDATQGPTSVWFDVRGYREGSPKQVEGETTPAGTRASPTVTIPGRTVTSSMMGILNDATNVTSPSGGFGGEISEIPAERTPTALFPTTSQASQPPLNSPGTAHTADRPPAAQIAVHRNSTIGRPASILSSASRPNTKAESLLGSSIPDRRESVRIGTTLQTQGTVKEPIRSIQSTYSCHMCNRSRWSVANFDVPFVYLVPMKTLDELLKQGLLTAQAYEKLSGVLTSGESSH
ncbi:hypothetical protein HDU93_004875 [Gonapodya sp. JEL0774]|nr:hypothetical protein HDU93_004875 [Gonapodya sp. JEL0774]